MSNEQPPPPGWYPWSPTLSRYWDGAQWTDQTAPIPWGTATVQPYPHARPKWHNRRWVRSGLGLGAVALVGTVFSTLQEQQRSETDLGSAQSGSQQEWIEYFERSNDAVDQFNEAMSGELTNFSLTQILDALNQLSDSPDSPLNYTVETAIEACGSSDPEACFNSLDTVADQYNEVLAEAEADGLLEVSE